MFEAWGRLVYRSRRSVLALSAVALVASLWLVSRGEDLTTGTVTATEANATRELIEHNLGRATGSSFAVIFHSDALAPHDPAFREALRAAVEPLRHDPRVAAVVTPYDAPPQIAATMVGRSGHDALVQVDLRAVYKIAERQYPAVRALVHSNLLDVVYTGRLAFAQDLDTYLTRDLRRAELVSVPAALIVLVLVFGTLVAALTPLGVGALAVIGGMAFVFMLSRLTFVAQYSLNIVSLVGLGVAIDYSLFIVRRHQEELDRGASVPDALAHAVGTAGKAVAFSGLAVVIGLLGLMFYRGSYLAWVGIAGAAVVALAVLYALTFLPALLGVLGHHVNAGRVRQTRDRSDGMWHRLATWVMHRPIAVLVPTLAFLLLLGAPFLRLRMETAGPLSLPARAEARRGDTLLRREFPAQAQDRTVIAVHFPDAPPLTPARVGTLYDLSRRVAAMPGVARVESLVDLDPRMSREDYMRLAALPPAARPPAIQRAFAASTGGEVAVLEAVARPGTTREGAIAIVRAVRAIRRAGDGEVRVTGMAANDLDVREFIADHTPAAIGFVMVMTCLVLFALLRSVVLPLKAVAMNLLSITASFGALVWIFQEGHLHRLLGFTPAPIDPSLPVILFCTVFGLSMDYEVFLLTRMREEYLRTGDNTHAVAWGLERSGRIVTSAAAIMVVVFSAFALADVVLIKAVGFGMAVAIALDATVVRMLIVPATMRLFGRLNWWAPGPLALPRRPQHEPA